MSQSAGLPRRPGPRVVPVGPLTGLAGMAHLRSRLGEVYRTAEQGGTCVSETHALVVAEPVLSATACAVDRGLRLADIGECLRIVFCGGEVPARLGSRRAGVLVVRRPELPGQVDAVRRLVSRRRIAHETRLPDRVWVEGLPTLREWCERVLDELARP